MLPLLVILAAVAFATAIGLLVAGRAAPAAIAHVAFAAGVLPLLFGAMLHFVPVLTRGRGPGRGMAALPFGMLAVGITAAAAFLQPRFFTLGIHIAVLGGLTFSLLLTGWVWRCRGQALGTPHPGLDWYLAALVCLVLALSAATLGLLLPGQRAALRLFHLHLNTLGFIGLAALGTLAVLLPTTLARPDPGAAPWLRRMLPWAFVGVLLSAAGAAWWKPLSHLGFALLFVPAAWLGVSWLRRFRAQLCRLDGAGASLVLALLGFLLLLLAGLAHGLGKLAGSPAIGGFLLAFLLPLVIGAASQLLPIWLRPGAQGEWHRAARGTLGRFAVLRGLTFVVAGASLLLGEPRGAWLALVGLAAFAAQVLTVVVRK